MATVQACVRVIDDEPAVRLLVTRLLENSGYATKRYATAELFMLEDDCNEPGCALIDLALPGLSGVELVGWLGRQAYVLPCIVVTGFGTVPAAVQCLKLGALDFLEKPLNTHKLLECVGRAVALDAERRSVSSRLSDYRSCYQTLSERERQVLAFLSRGLSSKQIARELELSIRTVEKHRVNVMKKMRADSLADIVRASIELGLESALQQKYMTGS